MKASLCAGPNGRVDAKFSRLRLQEIYDPPMPSPIEAIYRLFLSLENGRGPAGLLGSPIPARLAHASLQACFRGKKRPPLGFNHDPQQFNQT